MAASLTELIAQLPVVVTDPSAEPQSEDDVAKLKAQYVAGMDSVANQGVDVLANLVRNIMQTALSGPLTMKQRFDAMGPTAAGRLALIEVLTAIVKSQRPSLAMPGLPTTHTYTRNPDGTVTATEK